MTVDSVHEVLVGDAPRRSRRRRRSFAGSSAEYLKGLVRKRRIASHLSRCGARTDFLRASRADDRCGLAWLRPKRDAFARATRRSRHGWTLPRLPPSAMRSRARSLRSSSRWSSSSRSSARCARTSRSSSRSGSRCSRAPRRPSRRSSAPIVRSSSPITSARRRSSRKAGASSRSAITRARSARSSGRSSSRPTIRRPSRCSAGRRCSRRSTTRRC